MPNVTMSSPCQTTSLRRSISGMRARAPSTARLGMAGQCFDADPVHVVVVACCAWQDAGRVLEGIDLVRVVAASTDLMDRSRIAATVPGVVLVQSLTGVEADVVLVDVSRPALVAELRAVRAARIVGYAPHVDDAAQGAALAAGCTEVLARSVFFHRLPHLVAGQHPPEPS
jgi:hypothetical protein